MNIGEIKVKISADDSDLDKTLKDDEKKIKKHSEKTKKELDKKDAAWKASTKSINKSLNDIDTDVKVDITADKSTLDSALDSAESKTDEYVKATNKQANKSSAAWNDHAKKVNKSLDGIDEEVNIKATFDDSGVKKARKSLDGVIGDVEVKFSVDDDNLGRKLKGHENAVKKYNKNTKKQLKDNSRAWNSHAKKVRSSLGGVGGIIKKTAGATAVGLAAGAASFIAFANSVTATNREMETLAIQSNETVGDFKAISFAAATVGVEADQLSGQLEDMRRKFGEFEKVGTGAFQDYADVMGLTKDEARELAGELSILSGRDSLQFMVDQMEAAEVPTAQLGFVLDSLGSDADRLIPLLTGGGVALEMLTSKYKGLVVALDKGDLKAFDELSQDLGIATENFKTFLVEALSPFAPMFSEASLAVAQFFKTLTEESRDTDKVIEAQEKINAILKKTEVSTGRLTNARGKSTQAAKTGITQDESAASKLNTLSLKNDELNNKLQTRVALSTSAGRSAKGAASGLESFTKSTNAQIEANTVIIDQLRSESAEAQKLYDLRKQIQGIKTGKVDQPGKPKVDGDEPNKPESNLVAFTREETDAFISALRDRLGQTQESLTGAYNKEQEMLQVAVANKSITQEEANKRTLELESQYLGTSQAISNEGHQLGFQEQKAAEEQRYNTLVESLEKLAATEAEAATLRAELDAGHAANLLAIEEGKTKAKLNLISTYWSDRNALDDEGALLTEEKQIEYENTRYENALIAIESLGLAKDEARRLEENQEAEHKNRLDAIESKSAKAKMKLTKKGLSNLSSLMNTENRKLFAIGKAAAISNALINAKESVVSAYASGSEINPYVAVAYAATAAIAQGANIAQISSQSYGGGGSPTSYSGGVPAVNTQSAPSSSDFSGGTGSQTAPTQTTVNITLGGSSQNNTDVRELIELINEESGDGFNINVN